jgi:hypothetical protein
MLIANKITEISVNAGAFYFLGLTINITNDIGKEISLKQQMAISCYTNSVELKFINVL